MMMFSHSRSIFLRYNSKKPPAPQVFIEFGKLIERRAGTLLEASSIPARPESCSSTALSEEEHLDLKAVCRFFGGNKPIGKSTLYRGIEAGKYPKQVKITSKLSRWLKSECEAARRAIIESRPK